MKFYSFYAEAIHMQEREREKRNPYSYTPVNNLFIYYSICLNIIRVIFKVNDSDLSYIENATNSLIGKFIPCHNFLYHKRCSCPYVLSMDLNIQSEQLRLYPFPQTLSILFLKKQCKKDAPRSFQATGSIQFSLINTKLTFP
jgi:hypothetical protein